MKKYVILLLVLIIAGCKNAADEMSYEVTEDANELAVEEDFDKVAFYEEYLIDNFKEILESNRLRSNNEELTSDVKNELPITIPNDSLVQILVTPISENRAVSSNMDQVGNSYTYELTFWNKTDEKEYNYFGIWSIHEDFKVIDGDSIPTVTIIW